MFCTLSNGLQRSSQVSLSSPISAVNVVSPLPATCISYLHFLPVYL